LGFELEILLFTDWWLDLRLVRVRFRIHPLPLDAPRKLVRRGLYRILAKSDVCFGWAVLNQSPAVAVYGLAVALCFYSFVVIFEEPILSKRFGAAMSSTALKFLGGYSGNTAV
jgi:protein-S-isoprenylcysteine O-methyltransferase Ste14